MTLKLCRSRTVRKCYGHRSRRQLPSPYACTWSGQGRGQHSKSQAFPWEESWYWAGQTLRFGATVCPRRSAARRLSIVQSQSCTRADKTSSARWPGKACGHLVVEETGLTSSHGAEGAVADEASSVKLVARSATTWLELRHVYTRLLSTPNLAAIVMMIHVGSSTTVFPVQIATS